MFTIIQQIGVKFTIKPYLRIKESVNLPLVVILTKKVGPYEIFDLDRFFFRFCCGDLVIDTSNDLGRVVEVFTNGQARVNYDHYGVYPVSINKLSKATSCSAHICVGDRTMDTSNDVGTVKEVFDNGKAQVKYDKYGLYIVEINKLGKGWRCIENACVGDRVMDTSNDTGSILELFDNGKARVNYDHYGVYPVDFSKLGLRLNCRLRDNCSCRN
jgi:hypothetical protein